MAKKTLVITITNGVPDFDDSTARISNQDHRYPAWVMWVASDRSYTVAFSSDIWEIKDSPLRFTLASGETSSPFKVQIANNAFEYVYTISWKKDSAPDRLETTTAKIIVEP